MDANTGGEVKTVSFNIIGKQPSGEEARSLVNTPFGRKPISGAEVKDAIKWFAVGVGIAIFAWFFGRWVISKFVGIGVLFFGYGAAYLAAPISMIFGVVSLCKIFRSARKKKVKDALNWVFLTSYFGDDGVGTRFGRTEYAVSTLDRIVPESIPFSSSAAREYITRFRETLNEAMDRIKAEWQLSKDWNEGRGSLTLVVDDTRELYPNVLELSATLKFTDEVTRPDQNNKTITRTVGYLELHITFTMIQTGKYWFPYDIYPEIQSCAEISGGEEGIKTGTVEITD